MKQRFIQERCFIKRRKIIAISQETKSGTGGCAFKLPSLRDMIICRCCSLLLCFGFLFAFTRISLTIYVHNRTRLLQPFMTDRNIIDNVESRYGRVTS